MHLVPLVIRSYCLITRVYLVNTCNLIIIHYRVYFGERQTKRKIVTVCIFPYHIPLDHICIFCHAYQFSKHSLKALSGQEYAFGIRVPLKTA